jgi:hypothetical protein
VFEIFSLTYLDGIDNQEPGNPGREHSNEEVKRESNKVDMVPLSNTGRGKVAVMVPA